MLGEHEWEEITPEHLHSAIEHIRKEFQIGHYVWSDVTQTSCLCSLRPDVVQRKLLTNKPEELLQGLAAVGPQGQSQFQKLIRLGTPPSIFRAHFDLYYDILVILLRRAFDALLKIGLANWHALDSHPANWAKRHSVLMIEKLLVNAGHWIKHACDVQHLPEPDRMHQDFEEVVFWRKWRAPKLIYMQPAGNAPYDPTTVWFREDESRTNELLTARSKRFVEFLDLSLEKMAGEAHVAVAQDSPHSKRVPSDAHIPAPKTKQMSSRAVDRPAQEHPESASDTGMSAAAARQAVVKKVQNPQSYTFLTVAEASLHFEVRPRTIYRWLEQGRLRDGGRRGSITIESVLTWQKKRSRKRRNKSIDF